MKVFCEVLIRLANIYMIIMIAGIVASWLSMPRSNPIVKIISQITEPIYELIRRIIPTTIGQIDLAPMGVFIVITLIRNYIVLYAKRL